MSNSTMAVDDNFIPVHEADFELVYSIYMSDSINPYMSFEKISKLAFKECFDLMANRDEFVFYQENGVRVGIFSLTLGKWRKQHVATIGALAILPEHQGKGVASRMMLKVFDHLKIINIQRLELIVECDNPKAISLYKKLGFEIEGTLRAYLKRDNADEPIDDYAMSILL
ncbi:MAG: ribosomal protein S18 acetylase RimI-like enzyme [Gammaproteobacteria bacterium]|jgi:putative acetyltransferase